MQFTKVFSVKKEVSEQQFLRNVLIGLTKDEKSPSNIMKAKFGKVVEFNSEILVLSADVEVNYSGSCGYDRQEQYQTTESKYIKEGEYYTCNGVTKRASYSGSVRVDVVKTRTVTDWSPHNGTIKATKASFALNEDNGDEELANLFPKAFEEAKDESVVEEGNATINLSAYESAIGICERKATYEVRWPGDHHKDEKYNFKTDVDGVECYIVPCYMVEFEYNGKKYRARGLAIGKTNEVHEMPKSDGKVESIEIIEKRRKLNVAEAEKPLKIKKLFTVISVIMGIVAVYGIINSELPNSGAKFCLPFGLIAMAISIIISIIIKIKVNKAVEWVNIIANNEKRKLNTIKADSLNDLLKKLNLPTLSVTEKNSLTNVSK